MKNYMKNKHNYLKKIEIKTTISNKEDSENDTVYSNVLNFNQEGLTVLTDYKMKWNCEDNAYIKSNYKKLKDREHRNNFSENFTSVLAYLKNFTPRLYYTKINNEGIYKNQWVKADIFITLDKQTLIEKGERFIKATSSWTTLQRDFDRPEIMTLNILKDRKLSKQIFGEKVLSKDYEPFPWLEGETFVIEMPEDFLEEKLLPTFINNLKKIAKKNQVILITNIMSDLNLTDVSPREVEAVKELLKGCKAQSMEFSGEHSSINTPPLNMILSNE
jgi:hypothetical protein